MRAGSYAVLTPPSPAMGAGLLALTMAFLSTVSRMTQVPSLGTTLCAMAFAWLVYFVLYSRSALPRTVMQVMLWALLLRGCTLWAVPELEDDWARFLVDGWASANFGSPYGVTPLELFEMPDIPLGISRLLSEVNNPDLPTIYGPTAQMFFFAAFKLGAGALWGLKVLLMIVDLGCVLLLANLFGRRCAWLYATCPLVLIEIHVHSHFESLGLALVLLSLWALKNKHALAAGILFALAVHTRIFALPFGLYLLGQHQRAQILSAATLTWVSLTSCAIFAGYSGISLGAFYHEWEFNSGLYAIFAQLASPTVAKFLGLSLILGAAFLLYKHCGRNASAAQWMVTVLGALFLVAPVVNPWYLVWLVPFGLILKLRWTMAFGALSLLSYIQLQYLDENAQALYNHPAWVRPVEYGCLFVVLLKDRFRPWSQGT